MANAIYPKFKEALLQASSNSALTGTVKAALVHAATHGYVSTDQFYSDISAAVVGTPQSIANHTYTNGVFSGDPVTYTSLSGSSGDAIVLYIDTGTAGTSRLIYWIDTGQTNLPVTPNGTNVTITWNASGIFQL
ncbi:MAG: hypothetical protein ACXWIU_12320 [Limisphaerales bacterium]